MATTPNANLTELTAAILPTRRKKIADAISNRNFFWNELKRKGRIRTESGGTQIEERLMYDQFSVQNYVGAQTWILDGKPTLTASQWPWVQKFLPVVANGREVRIAMADEDSAIRFVKERIEVAHASIANHMGVEVFGDGSTNSAIYGLKALVTDSGAGVVGGVDSSVATNWQNQAVHQDFANFGSTTIRNDLNIGWLSVLETGGKTGLLLGNHDVYAAMENALVPQQRYMADDVKRGEANFEQMGFKGVPLVADYNSNFTTGGTTTPRCYLLDLDTFYVFQHKDAKWERDETRVPPDADMIIIPFIAMMNQVTTNRRYNCSYYVS